MRREEKMTRYLIGCYLNDLKYEKVLEPTVPFVRRVTRGK